MDGVRDPADLIAARIVSTDGRPGLVAGLLF
jgi:hypothetical protein